MWYLSSIIALLLLVSWYIPHQGLRFLHVVHVTRSYPSTTSLHAIKVALTRERGKNAQLEAMLSNVECLEIPCIAFQTEPGASNIMQLAEQHDIVLITSPQAAKVFLDSWHQSPGKAKPRIVTVGKGTSKPLLAEGFQCDFEPTEATAACLAQELPLSLGKTILYPCSAIASDNLASDLNARGFEVTRLETYRTVPALWSEQDFELAKSANMVTFASPSAVRIWKERVGTMQSALVIGPTSEKAAKEAGFKSVFSSPEGSHGLDLFATLIQSVAEKMLTESTSK